MWGWIVALVTALAGTGVVWYFRSRSVANSEIASLLAENKSVLQSVNSLLSALAVRANEANKQDQEEAKNVDTAKEASDFLNASGGPVGLPTRDSSTRVSAASRVRSTSRPAPSKPVDGFARGPSHDDKGDCLRPGSMVEGRDAMARSRFGMYEEWC